MRSQSLSAAQRLFLLLAAWVNVLPVLRAQELGESCYYFLGDYPFKPPTPGWQVDVQGVGHDRDHWFITQEMKIWKIPVGHDLNSSQGGFPTVSLRDVMPGYNHFGDPECYETNGQTFLLVPVERQPLPAAIALFRADPLAYVAHANLDQHTQAPWCAVDTNGNVYTSSFNVDSTDRIRKYEVDWERLIASGELRLTLISTVPLLNERGEEMSLPNVQGGVITPSGTLIYLVAGYYNQLLSTDGIHVFDLGSGRRVKRSTNGYGPFNFEFYPGNFEPAQEPEGLTFWDLDDGRAPGISGQLHVLLLDNDAADPDDVIFKHYTGTLHVDRSYNGINGTEKGSLRQPFNTVNEANNLINLIWDGAQIITQITIRSGSYPEALTFSKPIKVVASRGPVIIGQ